MSSKTKTLLLSLATGFVAFIIRLPLGGLSELWHDEACTYILSKQPLYQIVKTSLSTEVHTPIFYFIQHFFIALFGPSILGLRMLSIMAGSVIPVVVFLILKRHLNTLIALLFSLWVAVHPLMVYYSIDARHYALLQLMELLVIWAFLEDKNILGSILAGLTGWLHPYGLFILIPVIFVSLRKKTFKYALYAFFVALPAILFAGYNSIHLTRTLPAASWFPRMHLSDILSSALMLQGTGPFAPHLAYLHGLGPGMIPGILVLITLILLLIFNHTRVTYPILLLIVTIISVWILPVLIAFVKPMFLIGRHDTPAIVFLVLVTGIWIKKSSFKAIISLFMIGISLFILGRFVLTPRYYPVQIATESLKRHKVQGVIFTGLTGPLFEWSFDRQQFHPKYWYFPEELSTHPCWVSYRQFLGNKRVLIKDALDIAGATNPLKRIGIIVRFDMKTGKIGGLPVNRYILALIEHNFRFSGKWFYPQVGVSDIGILFYSR